MSGDLAGVRVPEPGEVLLVTRDADGALARVTVLRSVFAATDSSQLLGLLKQGADRLRETTRGT